MNDRELAAIKVAAMVAKDGDLYRALHLVGDDPIKSCIEDTLKELLPEQTYKQVLAVFNIFTDDDLYNELFPGDDEDPMGDGDEPKVWP